VATPSPPDAAGVQVFNVSPCPACGPIRSALALDAAGARGAGPDDSGDGSDA
jgi:hypothetical protein